MDTGLDNSPIWPLIVYFAAVLAVVVSMIGGSYLLGSKNRNRKNLQPYESGVASTGSARVRLSNDFYLYAMFFVIFDLESVFIYSWSIAIKDLGWTAYGTVAIFVGAILAALTYLWRLGALEPKR
ncbi:MAG TPA: NADH-quinone oxidoreductase subunit A [Candidatus Hydrogenedentes bacterium]|nr:NADH-quinone oxidoreductase subunit A [Candidatus Hydrogenedentota bacterium]HRK33509.1 NADH-quinone oxidoreductase subunit A [Candidatus Hydrogenedentota bacterium]